QFFNYFNNPSFSFDPSTAAPANYVNTVMTTSSVTPRLDMRHQLFGLPNRLLTGIDFYNTQYDSDRPQAQGLPDIHRYSIRQTTASIYAMNTTTVTPALEISYGGGLPPQLVKGHALHHPPPDPHKRLYSRA